MLPAPQLKQDNLTQDRCLTQNNNSKVSQERIYKAVLMSALCHSARQFLMNAEPTAKHLRVGDHSHFKVYTSKRVSLRSRPAVTAWKIRRDATLVLDVPWEWPVCLPFWVGLEKANKKQTKKTKKTTSPPARLGQYTILTKPRSFQTKARSFQNACWR